LLYWYKSTNTDAEGGKVLALYKQYLDHTQKVARIFEDARTLLGFFLFCLLFFGARKPLDSPFRDPF
jgi:hypothetical protein